MTTIQRETPAVETSQPVRSGATVGAMPDTRDVNFYESDPYLQFVLRRRLSPAEWALGAPRLRALGARIGNEIEALAAEADRQTPTLKIRDKRGERVDELVVSRAYRELERILYGEFGLAAMALRPGVLAPDQPSSLVLNDAFMYLAEQGEAGLFCPLSMTRALARTLVKFAPPELVERYLPRLTSTDLTTLYTGAMFMTEKQGGSDLGLTATTARPSAEHPDLWELHGEKWFCSNVGAELMLTLARPEGAEPGTRGLGLFLLPRELPDGTRNHYRIERVKDKLGMRSFASGEVTLDGAQAYLIGGPGQGWLQMTEMLNITRLGCASAAAALARRSFLESLVHARGRVAFGRALADLPLMRAQLLDLLLDVEALTGLFFEGSAQLDAADHGDAVAARLARALMPLAKFHASEEARRVVAEGMEVRGGNAYIEDWPNARMLRDVQVQAIWEGTGNISALDVGRALGKPEVAATLLETYQTRLAAVENATVARAARLASGALTACGAEIRALVGMPPERREARLRGLTRRLARAITAALLVEDAQHQAREDGSYRCLVQAALYLRREVYPPRWGATDAADVPIEHFDALVDWTPALPAGIAEPLLAELETTARR
ncbi:MAG TPA: acyl-CoA dehydrogenase family protein [Ktedonobacterales bacterium]